MKRILAAICALPMLAATLSGCSAPPAASTSGGNSAPPAQSPAPAGPVTIRLYGLNAAWSAVMDQAAADYNRETGNTLEVEIAGDDYSAVLAARFNSNQAPDIFELANSDILAWADRLADVSGCKFSEALYDSAKSSAYVDGVCYGMPCGISAGGFVYNKDLFDQAGITKLPKTLDELEETCIQLQQAGIQPFGEAWKEWGYLAQLFGYAFLYEDDTRVLADRLNSGGMQLADLAHIGDFFRLYDMTLDYGLGEQSIGYGVYDQVADFAAGKMAMIKQGTWLEALLLATNPELKIGIFAAPLTDNPADTKLPIGTAGALVVNKESPVAEQAKEFLDWFYGHIQTYLVDGLQLAVPYSGTDNSKLGMLNNDMFAYMERGEVFDTLGFDYWPAGYLYDIATPLQAYAAGAATAEATLAELQNLYNSRVNSVG